MPVDFEEHREHLRAVAFRILGSRSDADDAVSEAWLRMNRSDLAEVRNPRGWLTTVVARVSLDMLRARNVRSEQPLNDVVGDGVLDAHGVGPEEHAVLADSVGVALMVVLQTLRPAERLTLVLHDVFDVPFTEIGPVIDRSANATAQLAVRARRRVRGRASGSGSEVTAQRRVVDAFLAASRDGEFDALLALLHPDVELHADAVAAGGASLTVRGAHEVAARARMFAANAQYAEPALVDGCVGVLVAPEGPLKLVLRFAIDDGTIVALDIHADPARLAQFELALLE
jgi:RNA polymerase sigma factor (sigma-70 family)